MSPAEFRAHRLALGKTQRELAKMLGFRRGKYTVSDIEGGRQIPSETVTLLLQAYVTLCKLSLPGKLSEDGQIVLDESAWPCTQIVRGWANCPRYGLVDWAWESKFSIDKLS